MNDEVGFYSTTFRNMTVTHGYWLPTESDTMLGFLSELIFNESEIQCNKPNL